MQDNSKTSQLMIVYQRQPLSPPEALGRDLLGKLMVELIDRRKELVFK